MGEIMRILGLDVGSVRIGVAMSDLLGITAQPVRVVQCSSLEADLDAIRQIVNNTGATKIIVGLPLNKEGQPGPQAEKVLAFVQSLRKKLGIEIETVDERFTTAMAERMLIAADVSRKKRKQVIDRVAAQQILQTYLDRQAYARKRGEA